MATRIGELEVETAWIDEIHAGTKLLVERQPIYARTQPPAYHQSVKTVDEIEPLDDGRVLVRLRRVFWPGSKTTLQAFAGSIRDDQLASLSGEFSRYIVIGIVG
jgi:hypothetical protein